MWLNFDFDYLINSCTSCRFYFFPESKYWLAERTKTNQHTEASDWGEGRTKNGKIYNCNQVPRKE